MSTVLTFCCLLVALVWVAALIIIAYPLSKKLTCRISDYIVKVCAPRVFAILSAYKHFRFIGYREHKAELPQQFLILSNHQSLLDIPLYMNFLRDRDLRFVAKDSLARHVPLVSEMLRVHEHAMIPRRGSPAKAMHILDSFAERILARGQIPVIFPDLISMEHEESTCFFPNDLLTFSAFRVKFSSFTTCDLSSISFLPRRQDNNLYLFSQNRK